MRALLGASLLAACAANAQPPQPSLSPTRDEADVDVPNLLEELDQAATNTVAASYPETVLAPGSQLTQGGLAFGTTPPGSEVRLDGKLVPVDRNGRFVLGFGRDHAPESELQVTYPDGSIDRELLPIEPRSFPESRVDGVPANTVNPYSDEDFAKIKLSTSKKNAAREVSTSEALWTDGFDWPARGRVTGVFGSRRVYNGEPRRPHSGVDIARPLTMASPMDFVGTPVRAPSAGIVRLAEPDMFFEGGLVLIDHGQKLESALMHMSRVDVKAGDLVEKGDMIGGVGMTGRATGPHVHWSLKWHDTLVDPQLLVEPME